MTFTFADAIRSAITDAYYDARDDGETMETAADAATRDVMALWGESIPMFATGLLTRVLRRIRGEEGAASVWWRTDQELAEHIIRIYNEVRRGAWMVP